MCRPVILPTPVAIGSAFTGNIPTLWADFVQTVLKSVLPGYVIGCGAAFLTALAIDRSPFLQRGLLPIGNLAARLADRRHRADHGDVVRLRLGNSKAAVVIVMCFFPMLGEHHGGAQSLRARCSAI